MDIELIREAVPVLMKGLRVTATLTVLSVLIGFNLGLLLAVMRLSTNRFISGFAKCYSTIFRGTPLLVQTSCSLRARPAFLQRTMPRCGGWS